MLAQEKKDFVYEKRVVAFIDILNFRGIVKKTESDLDLAQNVLEALLNIEKENTDSLLADITTFSDSIVISYPLGQFNIMEPIHMLMADLVQLSNNLIQKGIFLRGGITTGNLYHKGNVVFGQALIDAYDLETGCAHYPRIVIDENVLNFPSPQIQHNQHLDPTSFAYNFVAYMWTMYVARDWDGYLFVNYLGNAHIFSSKKWKLDRGEKHLSFMKDVRKYILQNHNETEDFGKKSKWRWMANYFNQVLNIINNEPDYKIAIDPIDFPDLMIKNIEL